MSSHTGLVTQHRVTKFSCHKLSNQLHLLVANSKLFKAFFSISRTFECFQIKASLEFKAGTGTLKHQSERFQAAVPEDWHKQNDQPMCTLYVKCHSIQQTTNCWWVTDTRKQSANDIISINTENTVSYPILL